MEVPASLAVRSLRELLLRAAGRGASGDVVVRERDGTEHRVTLRDGRVVAVRVAGRFDPLLDTLLRDGALDAGRWHAVLEAMTRSELPVGQLATEVGGVPARRVRATLVAQLRERLRVLLERALATGREAWLERRVVPPSEGGISLSVLEALPVTVESAPSRRPRRRPPGPPRSPRPPKSPRPPGPCGPPTASDSKGVCPHLSRRELRRLALALHPDRHPDLDPKARAALERRLAEATAAFHGLR